MLAHRAPERPRVDEAVADVVEELLYLEGRAEPVVERSPVIGGLGLFAKGRAVEVFEVSRRLDRGRRLEIVGRRVIGNVEAPLPQRVEERRVVVTEVVAQDAARSVLLEDDPVHVAPVDGDWR